MGGAELGELRSSNLLYKSFEDGTNAKISFNHINGDAQHFVRKFMAKVCKV